MSSHLQQKVESFDTRSQFGNQDANIQFLEATGLLNKNMKILEIGSGCGHLLNYLLSQGFNVTGIEIDQTKIIRSQKLYGNLPLKLVDSEFLPFDDCQFDLVLSFDVFEHIYNSVNHLQEVSRVLQPDGHYLLQTPNRLTNVVFETIRWKSFTRWRHIHCSLHDYWQLRQRFQDNSFSCPLYYDIPVVNTFFKAKVKRFLGVMGIAALNVCNPDKLPLALRTNFYIQAQNRKSIEQLQTSSFAFSGELF